MDEPFLFKKGPYEIREDVWMKRRRCRYSRVSKLHHMAGTTDERVRA